MYKVLHAVTRYNQVVNFSDRACLKTVYSGRGARINGALEAIAASSAARSYTYLNDVLNDALRLHLTALVVALGEAYWVLAPLPKTTVRVRCRIEDLPEGNALGYTSEQAALVAMTTLHLGV